MSLFKAIPNGAPHMRLHEWVAREKGYFEREGLDYEFRDQLTSPDGKLHDLRNKVGAYQMFDRSRSANVSCACHWTVNVAASVGSPTVGPGAPFAPAARDASSLAQKCFGQSRRDQTAGAIAAVPAPGCGWMFPEPAGLGPGIRLESADPDGTAPEGGVPGWLVKLPA
jgi:hypothetical protein